MKQFVANFNEESIEYDFFSIYESDSCVSKISIDDLTNKEKAQLLNAITKIYLGIRNSMIGIKGGFWICPD